MKSKRVKINQEDAKYYEELGEQWANRDLADYWQQTREVAGEINIKSSVHYYPIESKLSSKLAFAAKRNGTTVEALLNKWLQEKLQDKTTSK